MSLDTYMKAENSNKGCSQKVSVELRGYAGALERGKDD